MRGSEPEIIRFAFGKNWARYLNLVDEDRICRAKRSLQAMLGVSELEGRFLDIGSGSGLFSLAARRLGAQVHSFDYDADSVATTRALKERFAFGDDMWSIEHGSVLDDEYMQSLGPFDTVYSWGVLHHTGGLWDALTNAISAVAPDGHLFIAVYNDQGWKSRMWMQVKRLYNRGGPGRLCVIGLFFPYFAVRALARSMVTRENAFANYDKVRGMSIVHDWVDWLGGYPYEVATADQIVTFCQERGLILVRQRLTASLGNNEFVFSAAPARQRA